MAQPSHDLEDDLSPGKIIEYYIGSSTNINKLSSELTRSCSFSKNPFFILGNIMESSKLWYFRANVLPNKNIKILCKFINSQIQYEL